MSAHLDEPESLPAELMKVVSATRTLFRIARYPRCDASWPELKARLIIIEQMLRERRDPAGSLIHREVLIYLGYRYGRTRA